MLRGAVLVIAAAVLAGGSVALVTGAFSPAFFLGLWGALIVIGTLYERVRYKPLLEQPPGPIQPGHVEAGLQLALELRDSVITYRTRYLAVMQAAPALDLILADEGNPRGLAFQLLDRKSVV